MSEETEVANTEKYEIIQKIGQGRHSIVFQGANLEDGSRCAIKVMRPFRESKFRREIEILRAVSGGTNIITLLDVIEGDEDQEKTPSLIFEYIENCDFRSLFPRLTGEEIKYYLYELLKALEFIHGQGIMHRDLRPHNLLIDHANRRLCLIDFGQSAFYHPNTEYSARVGRAFKPPELLLSYEEYDYGVDMWQLGSILASLIFRVEPFFHGNSNQDQLDRITRVLGTNGLLNYVERYEMDIPELDQIAFHERTPWESYINDGNRHRADAEAIDLLDKVLRWDHKDRLSAKQCMEHAYFHALHDRSNTS